MPFVDITDGQLYYEIHGAGPALVLAHGVGGNHASWYQQVVEFSKRFQVVTFDHRGFGNSSDPRGHGRSGFVADLHSLLTHLKLDRAILVGQSMGGGTCVAYTCSYPEKVRALLVCDSLHGFVEPPNVADIMNRARRETENSSQLERVLGDTTRLGNPIRALLYSQLNSFNRTNRHSLRGRLERLFTPDELERTGVPVAFLVGQFDVLFPAAAVREMQRLVRGSSFIEIEGAGHSVFFEEPGKFNEQVLEWLDALDSEAGSK